MALRAMCMYSTLLTHCLLWQAGPVMQTGAPAVFSMAGACCIACRPFQLVVALQGVSDMAVVMYTATRSLWGPFVGPLSKVHAPWGMQHPPPLARKRGAMCEVLAHGMEPQQAWQLLRTWCAACDPLCTEVALQEAAGAGGQGSVVSGSCWPYHRVRSFRMKAPPCDAVLRHPYIAENATELQ